MCFFCIFLFSFFNFLFMFLFHFFHSSFWGAGVAGGPLRRTAPRRTPSAGPPQISLFFFFPSPVANFVLSSLSGSFRGIVVQGHSPPKVRVSIPWGHFVTIGPPPSGPPPSAPPPLGLGRRLPQFFSHFPFSFFVYFSFFCSFFFSFSLFFTFACSSIFLIHNIIECFLSLIYHFLLFVSSWGGGANPNPKLVWGERVNWPPKPRTCWGFWVRGVTTSPNLKLVWRLGSGVVTALPKHNPSPPLNWCRRQPVRGRGVAVVMTVCRESILELLLVFCPLVAFGFQVTLHGAQRFFFVFRFRGARKVLSTGRLSAQFVSSEDVLSSVQLPLCVGLTHMKKVSHHCLFVFRRCG